MFDEFEEALRAELGPSQSESEGSGGRLNGMRVYTRHLQRNLEAKNAENDKLRKRIADLVKALEKAQRSKDSNLGKTRVRTYVLF